MTQVRMIDLSKKYEVRVEKLLDLPFYTEGPAVDKAGNCFFTTLTGGRIMRLTSRAPASWASMPCPNGQAIDAGGDHLVCDSRASLVRRLDRTGRFLKDEVFAECAGRQVKAPNDVVAAPSGGFYFTDSVRHEGKVFYKKDDKEVLIAEKLDYPNGLALLPGGCGLLVAESYANRVLKLSWEPPGAPSGKTGPVQREVLADLPRHPSGSPLKNLPDGLALDSQGNVWVAHYGMGAIQVLAGDGKLLATIPTRLPLTSNLCFVPAPQASPEEQKMAAGPGAASGRQVVLLVSGGFSEPGPGAVMKITLENP